MTAHTFVLPRRWLALAFVACFAFAGIVTGSVSASAAQKTLTTINLCITKAGPDKGTVRFAATKHCPKGQVLIQVVGGSGSQGVAGIQESSGQGGSTGAAGPQGPPGPKGDTGAKGETGVAGADGDDGQNGATGPQGPAGPAGPAGPIGPAGPAGPQGPAGNDGAPGAPGAPGADGANGKTVLSGTTAPDDTNDGVNGDFYIDTSTNKIYGPKAGGSWPAGVSLKGEQGVPGADGAPGAPGAQGPAGPAGPQGPAGNDGAPGAPGAPGADGANGKTVLSGTTAPDDTNDGVNGDFYIDTSTNKIYGPKAGGSWPAGVSLKGEQGVPGADGAPGAPGAQGPAGPAGPQGPAGNDGAPGAPGAPGADGANGKTVLSGTTAPDDTNDGVNGDFYIDTSTNKIYGPKAGGSWPAGVSLKGEQGVPGADGAPGADGHDGAPGAQGPAGPAGPQGPAGNDGAPGAPGAPGADGANGKTVLSGTTAPDDTNDGVNGDFYIDTSTNKIYGPKAGGSWPAGVWLKGEQGVPGADGAPGADGHDGAPGAQGPAGPAGPQGPAGNDGAPGAPGAPGADGANGKTVLSGTTAPDDTNDGVNGDFYIDTSTNKIYGPKAGGSWPAGVSLKGEQGVPGADGAPGAPGAQGPAGPAGPQGPIGPQGPAGADGKTVLNGAIAPAAGVGTNGDFYIDTTESKIYGPKAGGAWPAGVSLKGAQGSQGTPGTNGTNGKTVLNGTVAPVSGTGTEGDFYINTTESKIYGPKVGTNWGSGTSLKGAQGTPGTNGQDGAPGAIGPAGPSGVSTTFVAEDSSTDSLGESSSNVLVTGSSTSITAGQWVTATAMISVSKSTSSSRTVKCGFREGSTNGITTAVGTTTEITLPSSGTVATIALSQRWQPTAGSRFFGVTCNQSNSSSVSTSARTLSGMVTNG